METLLVTAAGASVCLDIIVIFGLVKEELYFYKVKHTITVIPMNN